MFRRLLLVTVGALAVLGARDLGYASCDVIECWKTSVIRDTGGAGVPWECREYDVSVARCMYSIDALGGLPRNYETVHFEKWSYCPAQCTIDTEDGYYRCTDYGGIKLGEGEESVERDCGVDT